MSARYRASCDCGWSSKPLSSQAKADYSHRRHSCDAHRARTERAARVAARKSAAGTTRDCTHLDEHGQPRHQHGERNAYVLDRCRCRPCRDAASRYERQRARDRAYGRQSYLDAGPVRDHVNALRAQGMGWKRIAAAAGLETSVVWKLLYGDPTRGQAPTKRVTPKTRDALLAVTLDLAPGRIIDGTGTRRRLQALVAIGWSMSEIARRLNMLPSNLGTIIHGRTEITAGTARKATVLYDELWSTPAPPSGRHGAVPARARAYAQRHGWAPPLAWDDDTIDDASASPFVGQPASITRAGGGRVNLDSLTDCAIAWGMTIPQAADRLHVHTSSIVTALRRLEREGNDDGTLAATFERNAIAQGRDRPTRDGLPRDVRDRGRTTAA